jgi:hypothetical protein
MPNDTLTELRLKNIEKQLNKLEKLIIDLTRKFMLFKARMLAKEKKDG